RGGIRGDGRADRDAAVLGDLRGDIADAADVQVAVLLGKAKLGAEILAHDVAVQQRYRTPAHLHQLDHQRVCDGGFARSGKAGEEHSKALLAARRTGTAQFLDLLGKGKPIGNFQSFLQPAAQFGARDVQDRDVVAV